MASQKYSQMPLATPLTGIELMCVSQGSSKQTTVQDVLNAIINGQITGALFFAGPSGPATDNGIRVNGPGSFYAFEIHFTNQLAQTGTAFSVNATGDLTAEQVHAVNGFSGSGLFTTFTIVDGIVTAAS